MIKLKTRVTKSKVKKSVRENAHILGNGTHVHVILNSRIPLTCVNASISNAYNLAFTGQPFVPENRTKPRSRPLHHSAGVLVQ